MSASLEIQNLADRLVIAWNAGDGKLYGSAFTTDCDYITFNGDHLRSREEVASSHAELFRTHLKGSKLVFESLEMREVNGAILVHSIGNSLLEGQKQLSPSRRSIQTFVATRTNGEWLFASFQNTRIYKITLFRAILMKFGI